MGLIRSAVALLFAVCAVAGQDNPRPKRDPGTYAVFETSLGKIVCRFYEKEAPDTVANFIGLAEGSKEWTHPETGKRWSRRRTSTTPFSIA